MITSWTAGLNAQDKKDIKANFIEALVLRKRAIELLEAKIDASRTTCLSKNTYDNPSWALVQADHIGYERAMKELIKMLS